MSHLEHVSEAEKCDAQLNIPFVGVHSSQSLTAKANAPLMFRSRSPVNQIPLRSRSDIKCLQKAYFFLVYFEIIE